MSGSWPVLICYTVLIGFCVPVLWLYGLLLYACELTSHDFYNPLGQLSFVVYPLMQGALYGGVAWMMILLGNVVRGTLSRRRTSRGSSTNLGRDWLPERGSEIESPPSQAKPQTEAWSSWRTDRTLLAITALIVILYSIASLLVLLPTLPSTWTVDFDRNRYAEIYGTIKADKQHLLGKSLEEATRAFGLDNIPWDDGAFQQESGMFRIYHFRGFALYITLNRLPAGITSNSNQPWRSTGEELQRHGVLWLAGQIPFVRADGINDPKERMKRYWHAIDEECIRINAEMKKNSEQTR
jgi:hypothetical protein